MEKKVSIIIPVYNVKKELLDKCIRSVELQTYHNFEVIVVDDCTNEINKEQLEEYKKEYNNIRVVVHEENKGLFRARITGVENAKGEYILFVDADDYITVDWLRLLVKKAESENADITMGNTICENEEGLKYIINIAANYLKNKKSLEGEAIFKFLMEDEGRYFPIHTIWNKLYTKKIWKKIVDMYKNKNVHLIMTEDILFSVLLFYYAEKMAFTDHDGYFYYRNAESSTFDVNGVKKISKNLDDIKFVFDEIKRFLNEKNLLEIYNENYLEWKDRYFRWWSPNVDMNTKNIEQIKIKEDFLSYFEKTDFEYPKEEDSLFDIYTTKWEDKLERIKEAIIDSHLDVVSFDIFDTLILRPVLEPEDIFEILEWENPVNGKFIFKTLRRLSEKSARKVNFFNNPQMQDIGLTQIYDEMGRIYKIDKSVTKELQKKEEQIEIEISQRRDIGWELYELSRYVGKKIILVSDMYLEKDIVSKILEKNGFIYHEKLYLSSEEKALKSTGKLFEIVRKDFPKEKYRMIHMGDNWNSDYIVPQKYDINTFFIPKTKDILFNTLGDKFTGNSIGYAVDNQNSVIDLSEHLKKLPVRCMYAVVANGLYDNPFISYNDNGNYNGDPYLVGNLAVGMYLFGIALWLIKDLVGKKINKIDFTSRDGYFVKNIYDLICNQWNISAPKSDYVFVSRKALIPVDIEKKEDVLFLINSFAWQGQSPKKILDTYHSIVSDLNDKVVDLYKKKGFILDKNFESEDECFSFLTQMMDISFDEEKAAYSRACCQKYFEKNITPNDVLFDLGYSGKLQQLIVKALGYPVDGYYVHGNGFETKMKEEKNRFRIKCFYDFIPVMSGAINEFIMSDYGPSCVGYEKRGEEYYAVFENKEINLISKYIIDEIHRGAQDFVSLILKSFKNHKEIFQMQGIDTGLQYEKFLMEDCIFDKKIFRCCTIEDEYYGGVLNKKIEEIWKWQIENKKLKKEVIVEEKPVYIEKEAYVENEMKNILLDNPIYQDGIFVKFYVWINSKYPFGSKKRERLKKIMGWFIK